MIPLIYTEKWGENYKKISCDEEVVGGIHGLRGLVTQKSEGCFYESLHSSYSPLHNNMYSLSLRLGLKNRSVYKVYF